VLASHLSLVEEQLSDGREWLFDSELPSLADISAHFVFAWAKSLPMGTELFDAQTFPKSLKWLAGVTAHLERLKESQPAPGKVTGTDAASIITSSSFEPLDVVGFDEREASRLGLKAGARVSITPDDSGRDYPTLGTLVALNREEFVIEVKASGGILRCHFPRVMFTAVLVAQAKM